MVEVVVVGSSVVVEVVVVDSPVVVVVVESSVVVDAVVVDVDVEVVVYIQSLYAVAASCAMMMQVILDANASTDASVHSNPAHSVRLSGAGQNANR